MPLHRFQRAGLRATPWKNGGGSTCEIACWPPFAFPGECALDCERLGGGTSSDFNVMVRRGRLRAELQLVREARALAPAPHGLLLALRFLPCGA